MRRRDGEPVPLDFLDQPNPLEAVLAEDVDLKDMPQVLDGSSALRGKIFTADQKSLFATSG